MNDSANTLDSTPSESWFVATGTGAVEYPLDALKNEIRQGRVRLNTLVWRNGMQAWVELEQVPLLRMLVTVQPSPVSCTALEPVVPVETVPTDLLDDLTDDKTTVLESAVEFATTSAPPACKQSVFTTEPLTEASRADLDHRQTSAQSAPASGLGLHPAVNASADEPLEPITIRPDPIETSVSSSAPDSTSIFKGLFDDPTTYSDYSDSDVVSDSDISDANDVVSDSDISDTCAEPVPQEPKSIHGESIRPSLARPATPRVTITGISMRPAEARPVFQAPKREPIGEGLARSVPTQRFSEKPAAVVASLPPSKPLYAPLIQPSAPVPTMRPALPMRASVAKTRPSILPPLSPLPITEPPIVSETLPAAISPTSLPKPRLERPVLVAHNSSVSVNAVVSVTQSIPPQRANSHPQPKQRDADGELTSSPTMVGMPPRLEPTRAPAENARASEPTIIGMPPRLEPSPAPAESARNSGPAPLAIRSRVETMRVPAEPAPLTMSSRLEPTRTEPTESTLIGMPPRMEPSRAGITESYRAGAPLIDSDSLPDSIYPSISSIQPALRGPRNVRRTLLMMGAVGAAAAASVVFAFTQSEHEQIALSAPSAQMRERNSAARVPAIENPETAEHPAGKPLEAPRRESEVATEKPATGTVQAIKSPRAAIPSPTQPVADERAASTNSGIRPNSNRVTRNTGVSPSAKSTPHVSGPPANGKASPPPDWEQGTVEKRAWMSPGF